MVAPPNIRSGDPRDLDPSYPVPPHTSETATAWHGTKFLNPARDGAVLPILHLNSYKISSETIFGSMSDSELSDLFRGYGYTVQIVDAAGKTLEERTEVHRNMSVALSTARSTITDIQSRARAGEVTGHAIFPLLILRSPKGWTCPAKLDGRPLEGSFRSHQVPVTKPNENSEHLEILEAWLRSYHPEELFDEGGQPHPKVLAACPTGPARIGMNKHAYGGVRRHDLNLPNFREYAIDISAPGEIRNSDTGRLGEYLRDVIRMNDGAFNFRIFCPDELMSNRLSAIFEATSRQFTWPVNLEDEYIGSAGRVLEILSEHTCQGWLQGYLLTGRHGLFPCYEAFAPIVDSMMNQYAKFLKVSAEIEWREPVSSLTYLLSSEGWRQDHNGYSHQGLAL